PEEMKTTRSLNQPMKSSGRWPKRTRCASLTKILELLRRFIIIKAENNIQTQGHSLLLSFDLTDFGLNSRVHSTGKNGIATSCGLTVGMSGRGGTSAPNQRIPVQSWNTLNH